MLTHRQTGRSAFTPIYGRLCDIIGRRGSMMIAITFFGKTLSILIPYRH